MATKRRRRRSLKVVREINVTPLMDLTFLLLIIFMITAPVLEYETDVSPPELSTDKGIDESDEPMMVNLSHDGTLWFQKERLTLQQLVGRLEYQRSQRPDVTVLIRADGTRPYSEVMGLMKAARDAGVVNVSLVTQPEA
ncbi:MAG: biopolymer transporter ExbD [Lentisphaeria bacterium]|nr:biopolymer transporter ExbD [Lentisphaeria bacterium]